jgi:molecular chaperone DnaK
MAANNKSLGKFTLSGIPPAPRGVPQIEVTFDIDADGILKVNATDKATGSSQQITITASSGLTEEEVEKMTREAEQFAEEDKKRRDLAETRNTADNSIYAAEKILREGKEQISEEQRKTIEEKIGHVRERMESEDVEAMRQAANDLLAIVQEIGTAVHQSAEGSVDSGEAQKDDDVVEGEFEEA